MDEGGGGDAWSEAFSIPLDFTVCVNRIGDNKGNDSSGNNNNNDGDDHHLPGDMLLNVWVDSDFDCAWVPNDQSAVAGNVRVFSFKGALKPRRHFDRDGAGDGGSVQVPDSLKMHFHNRVAGDDCGAEGGALVCAGADKRLEMHFASAIPLRQVLDGGVYVLGAWDITDVSCDEKGLPTSNICIIFQNNIHHHHHHHSLRRLPPMRRVELSTFPAPNLQHHENMKDVGEWLLRVLHKITHNGKRTGFSNMRTVCRDAWMTTFFPDLPLLFDQGWTTLPVSLACYILTAVLFVHDISPEAALGMLAKKSDPMFILQLTRDMLCSWTMCRFEGNYVADMCGKTSVEDQPFVNCDKPGARVFQQDDCEGRNQQACIHCKHMLIKIYHDMHYNESKGINAHFLKYPPIGPPFSCLDFTGRQDDLLPILRICARLGGMFVSGELEAHMAVGDVDFKHGGNGGDNKNNIHSGENDEDGGESLEGHSFGVLVFKDIPAGKSTSIIMETTSWDMTVGEDANDESIGSYMKRLKDKDPMVRLWRGLRRTYQNASVAKAGGQPAGIIIRSSMDMREREKVYKSIFTGHGVIFFSYDPARQKLTYGASLEDLNGPVFKFRDLSAGIVHSRRVVFSISLYELLAALATGQAPFPRCKEAHKMLRLYSMYFSNISSFRRTLSPPQQTEEETMRRCLTWVPVRASQHIVSLSTPQRLRLAFTWLNSCPVPDEIAAPERELTARGVCRSIPFMHSTIFIFDLA